MRTAISMLAASALWCAGGCSCDPQARLRDGGAADRTSSAVDAASPADRAVGDAASPTDAAPSLDGAPDATSDLTTGVDRRLDAAIGSDAGSDSGLDAAGRDRPGDAALPGDGGGSDRAICQARRCRGNDVYSSDDWGNLCGLVERCQGWQRCSSGVCTPTSASFVHAEGTRFVRQGQEFFARGINYFPVYAPLLIGLRSWQHSGDYRPEIVDDELAMLAGLGVNLLSIQTISSTGDCANLRDFLDRAQARGMLVNLFIGTGLISDPDQITAIPAGCNLRDHPALFAYDISWEPHFGDASSAARQALAAPWSSWLDERYSGVANAAQAFGGDTGLPTDGELCAESHSVKVAAFRRFVDDHVSAGYQRIERALRRVDPNHMIGVRSGYGGNGSRYVCEALPFDLRAGAKHLDFVSPEGYALSWTDRQHVLDRGGFTNGYADVGKPIFWSEYGVNTDGSCPSCTAAVQRDYFSNMLEMMRRQGANGGAAWWFVGIRPQSSADGEISDFGIVHDYLKYATSSGADNVPMRDGWLGLCTAAPADYGLYVSHDDHSGQDFACPDGLTGHGAFKPDSVAAGVGTTGRGADGRTVESGWMKLCSRDSDAILAVSYDDYGGHAYACPAGYSAAGSFKVDSVAQGAGVTGADDLGHSIESGWMKLCVRNGRAELARVHSGLSGQAFECPNALVESGRFKPDVEPLFKPAVELWRSELPGFAPATARAYQQWITVDRDLIAGGWKMYDDGTAAFATAAAGSQLVGVKTTCAGTTSRDGQVCVGNGAFNGTCPPKCLNAEWNQIEVRCAAGDWVKVVDGDVVEIAREQPVLARFSAGNTGEGRWLTRATTGGSTGVVRFGCNENVGAFGCRVEMGADTGYLSDAESAEVVISNGIAQDADVVFQMVAENVAWFGDRVAVTLHPVP
ncbi:MAG: hypothetical protein JXR83_21155 [Deltaproteobacteria bacterium]|nr:hypothetical protein [Deltaproteobacteria bacterium]